MSFHAVFGAVRTACGPGPSPVAALVPTAAIAAGGAVFAGPVWEEGVQGDAGRLPAGAQVTTGGGRLTRINGNLTSFSPGKGFFDRVDMYFVRICDPEAFFASVFEDDGGVSAFGGRLYVFGPDPTDPDLAVGILANNDVLFTKGDPRVGGAADDGSGAVIPGPGRYWIAITREGVDAFSAAGPIFFFETPEEVSGPDGEGGPFPLEDWIGGEQSAGGVYEIVFGATTYGSTGDIDCNCNALADACDIAFGDSEDENEDGIPDECGCRTDIDRDGETGFPDLLEVLTNFGGDPGFPVDLDCSGGISFDDITGILTAWGPCDGKGGT